MESMTVAFLWSRGVCIPRCSFFCIPSLFCMHVFTLGSYEAPPANARSFDSISLSWPRPDAGGAACPKVQHAYVTSCIARPRQARSSSSSSFTHLFSPPQTRPSQWRRLRCVWTIWYSQQLACAEKLIKCRIPDNLALPVGCGPLHPPALVAPLFHGMGLVQGPFPLVV